MSVAIEYGVELFCVGALWHYTGDLAAPLSAYMVSHATEALFLAAKLPKDVDGCIK